jgi:cytochrome o ubiquinol oxidase subunit 1
MPKNTGAGFIIAALAAACGFALIWQMWLPAGLGFIAMLAAVIIHTFNYNRDYYIPEDEVVRVEGDRTRLLGSHV